MKNDKPFKGVCPHCGATYTGRPALSRRPPYAQICPDCGIREALDSINIPEKEQQQILDIIHRNTSGFDE